jgi:hypothetical protein
MSYTFLHYLLSLTNIERAKTRLKANRFKVPSETQSIGWTIPTDIEAKVRQQL